MPVIRERELDSLVRKGLGEKPVMSETRERALFGAAEALLGARRERIESREMEESRSREARARRVSAALRAREKFVELLAFHPQMPAVVATLLVLVFSIATLRSGDIPELKLTFADLPDLPKNNDFSSRYDENYLAERQAYEREVEDAHRRTSGGI